VRRWRAATLSLAVAAIAAMTSAASAQRVRLAPAAVNDLFTGIGGNLAALKRGMDAAGKALADRPDDAEAMAWHGAALLLSARLEDVGFPTRLARYKQSTGEMNKAVSLEPDNLHVRMARGVALQIETPGMPRFANYPGLLENARADFQRMFDLQKDDLRRLSQHQLGELLQGLADLYSRQEKTADAERYYTMIVSMLPNTEYARRATRWMETKKPLPTPLTTCIGCHTR
jgi:tetratricopeptide (TPR) repeat protein